jgi:hypothetical protein
MSAAAAALSPAAPALPLRQNVPNPGLCFGTGLLLTLVLGAGLGALNLFKADWSMGEVTGQSVLIHAHAQIFGFVVLFVIGIVGHALPRISQQPLTRPWLLWVGFGATLLAQLVLPLGVWADIPVLARLAEALDVVAALALSATVASATVHAPASLRPWLRLGAIALVICSAWGLAGGLDQRLLLERPALWHLALWGFIAPLIFGMSCHILDMAGGFDVRTGDERPWAIAWAAGVALVVWAQIGAPSWVAPAGRLTELAVAVALSVRLGLFRPLRRPRSGAPFFASAYGWLLVSLSISSLQATGVLPDHQLIEDVARHSFTIGCVTQMIVGVALRALPVAAGVRLAFPALATTAYLLVNGSVGLRLGRVWAATQEPRALWLSGVSGFLALVGLCAFGASLVGTVRTALAKLRAAS